MFVIRFRNLLRLLNVKYNRREMYLDLKLVSEIALRQNSHLRFVNLILMFPCIMTQYTKITNKTQLCRIIIPWLLYMFRAIFSLIIRSI
jgi:hypothetical protein